MDYKEKLEWFIENEELYMLNAEDCKFFLDVINENEQLKAMDIREDLAAIKQQINRVILPVSSATPMPAVKPPKLSIKAQDRLTYPEPEGHIVAIIEGPAIIPGNPVQYEFLNERLFGLTAEEAAANRDIHEYLKTFREKNGLSQGALGKFLGLSGWTICQHEKGRHNFTPKTFKKVCSVFPEIKQAKHKASSTGRVAGISPRIKATAGIIRAKLFKYNDRLGTRLIKIRQDLDMTGTELSKLFNLTVEEIIKLEAGKEIPHKRVSKIAGMFGVTEKLVLDNVVARDPFGNPIGEE